MRLYSIREQLHQGEQVEDDLDEFFRRYYRVAHVGMSDQRRGIDRWFTDPQTRMTFPVEYKCDWLASDTGNAFIETISVDIVERPGWAISSEASWLVYALPQNGSYWTIPLHLLRRCLWRWSRRYNEVPVQNVGYLTWGLLVPIAELDDLHRRMWRLPPGG